MSSTFIAALAILGTMVLTSLYGLATAALRRRVTVRSPEAATLSKVVPAVNALLRAQGPQMQALVAILEAQKGVCNGNVDEALRVTKAAQDEFDQFLVESARVLT